MIFKRGGGAFSIDVMYYQERLMRLRNLAHENLTLTI
jgi:hypothetical protein